jgi:hypothetical protein
MSRKLVVAALTAACLMGFGACGAARAEPSVKASKSNASHKPKAGGQARSVKPTSDTTTKSTSYDRAGTDYGYK